MQGNAPRERACAIWLPRPDVARPSRDAEKEEPPKKWWTRSFVSLKAIEDNAVDFSPTKSTLQTQASIRSKADSIDAFTPRGSHEGTPGGPQ